MATDGTVEACLAGARFTPLHRDWLPVREDALAARLQSLVIPRDVRVLLVNATMGPQLYPSVADFFAVLQRVQPGVKVTSASYFPQVHELGAGVAAKGLTVVSVAEVAGWTVETLNGFGLVVCVGPSDLLAELMSRPGLTARLVCLDLAFYHQLIEATDGAFLALREPGRWAAWVAQRQSAGFPSGVSLADWVGALQARVARQQHRVVCYTCQPETKVRSDLERFFRLDRFTWRGFNYIPAGFSYGAYYQAEGYRFDVALLGSDNRDYRDLDPVALKGLRFLFLGSLDRAPSLARVRTALDLTVVPTVDEDTYARLVALCRCVVLPIVPRSTNVLLSVVDAMALGKVLLTPRRTGLARLAREGAPITFYEGAVDLAARLRDLVRYEGDLAARSERVVAFARSRMDIYGVLETMVQEQLVTV